MDPTTPAPEIAATDELNLLAQIMRRVDKLSRPSKVWLHDRLTDELEQLERAD